MTTKKSKVVPVLVGVGVCGVLALLGLVVLRVAVYESFKVPAGSMLPTLPVDSHVWSHKLDHAERGAVMVFRYPEHREQMFVKRVVGLPGEKIEVVKDIVTINGWAIPRCEVGPWWTGEGAEAKKGTLWVEHLGAVSYLVFLEDDQPSFISDQSGPFAVAQDQFFVLGDNRHNSHDSRMWFGGTGGGVPTADMQGRIRSADETKLPPGAEKLQAAFDACMAKKPAKTTP